MDRLYSRLKSYEVCNSLIQLTPRQIPKAVVPEESSWPSGKPFMNRNDRPVVLLNLLFAKSKLGDKPNVVVDFDAHLMVFARVSGLSARAPNLLGVPRGTRAPQYPVSSLIRQIFGLGFRPKQVFCTQFQAMAVLAGRHEGDSRQRPGWLTEVPCGQQIFPSGHLCKFVPFGGTKGAKMCCSLE